MIRLDKGTSELRLDVCPVFVVIFAIMPINNITVQTTDSNGYEYIEVAEWLAQQCSNLPCFMALQWGIYDTTIFEDTINGQPVVIQLWKGRCDKPLGSEFPGGIGAELGIYRRIPNKGLPSTMPDFLRPIFNLLPAGADVWWPYPELGVTVEFELINPETGQTFFRAGPSKGTFGYWLTKWMRFTSYDRYKASVANPTWAKDYWMVATVNGKKYLWGSPELAKRYEVHVAGVTTDGRLMHSMRYHHGGWQGFGNVESVVGNIGTVLDADVVRAGDTLHLCAINDVGNIKYTCRRADGSWAPFTDIEGLIGEVGAFTRISIANYTTQIFIFGVTNNGRLWFSIRNTTLYPIPTTTWSAFADVEAKTGERGAFVDVDCAIVGEILHICGVTNDGRLWHSLRRKDGTWQAFGDIESGTGDRGTIVDVACTNIGAELHVCAISSDGRLWHTIRRTDGSWQGFGDVEGPAGDRGSFVRVSIGDSDGALHVCGTTSDGKLWHTIRHRDGSWQPFIDVKAFAGDCGGLASISVDGA